MTPAIKISVVALAGVLGGCATTSVDRNFNQAQSVVQQRFGVDAKWLTTDEARREAAGEVDRLLQQPLSADDAVRIALAYSASLQTMLFDSAAVSSDVTQSARLPNPVFTFERLVRNEGGMRELEINRMLAISVLDLLLLPSRLRAADYQQQQVGWKLATDVAQTVLDARQACVRAVAAQAIAALRRAGEAAADASAELARRMAQVGNWSKLQRAREQAFTPTPPRNSRARSSALAEREQLYAPARPVGRSGRRLTLPDATARSARRADEPADAERRAWSSGSTCRWRAPSREMAPTLGLTQATRFVNVLEVGYTNNRNRRAAQERATRSSSRCRCSTGATRASRAPRPLYAGVSRARRRSRSTPARKCARHTRRIAPRTTSRSHYRDEIVPLRKRIADENAAALQRHADRRVRAARRRARAGGQRERGDRGAARLLAGRGRAAAGAGRQVAGSRDAMSRGAAPPTPAAGRRPLNERHA